MVLNLLICVSIFLLKTSAEEIVPGKEMIRSHTSNNSMKHWFSYIKQLLQKNLNNVLELYFNFQHSHTKFMEQSLKRVHALQNKSKVLSVTTQEGRKHWSTSSRVTAPCGRLQALGEEFRNAGNSYKHTWKFKLDKHLRLNLTFQYINIYALNIESCYIGSLAVINVNSNSKQSLLLCGIHALIPWCPEGKKVNVKLSVEPWVSYHVDLSYSVIDPDHIVSSAVKKFGKYKPVWILQFEPHKESKLQIQKYHMHVSKYKQILVRSTIGKYLLRAYNGPGTLSEHLKPIVKNTEEEKYQASSFQCVIYIYVYDGLLAKAMSFSSRTLVVTRHIRLSNKAIVSYSNLGFHNFGDIYLVEMITQPRFTINVTVTVMEISYNNNHRDFKCLHAGLTAYDTIHQHNAEISTECFSQKVTYSNRNIYSMTSSMLLVVYSYREYSSMNLTLDVSTTPCKVHRINTCESTYYELGKSDCTVYQFFQELSPGSVFLVPWMRFGIQCKREILFPAVNETQKHIEVFVTGFLKGEHSSVRVMGVPAQICHQMNSTTKRETRCAKDMPSFRHDIFPVVVTRKTPTNNESLGFRLSFQNSERNIWLDMIVKIVNETEQNITVHYLDCYLAGENIILTKNWYQVQAVDENNINIDPDLLIYFYFKKRNDIINIKTEMCYYISSQFYLWQELLWLSTYNPGYLLSFHVPIKDLFLQSQGEANGVLKAYWIERQDLQCLFEVDTGYEGNFSKYICGSYKYYSFRPQTFLKLAWNPVLTSENKTEDLSIYHEQFSQSKLTWKDASDFCKSKGSHLPIINSRNKNNELVNIWKSAKGYYEFPAKGIIYIGLNKTQEAAVWENGDPVAFQPWKENNHVSTQPLSSLYETLIFCSSTKHNSLDIGTKTDAFLGHTEGQFCTAISLDNLAYPEWIPVRCDEPLTTSVLCSEYQNVQQSIYTNLETTIFNSSCIIKANTCYIFQNDTANMLASTVHMNKNIVLFKFLFDAIGIHFPPVVVNKTHKAVYDRYKGFSSFHIQEIKQHENLNFFVISQPSWKFKFGGNIFVCLNQRVISINSLCDGHNDCGDSTDETGCKCQSNEIYSHICKYIVTQSNRTMCSDYYLNTVRDSCEFYETFSGMTSVGKLGLSSVSSYQLCSLYMLYMDDQISLTNVEHSCMCDNEIMISISMINDLVVDCGEAADDEYFLSQMKMGNFSTCLHKYQIPCRTGHPKCYNISQICSYKLNSINTVIPCRTGSHLENCEEFECNMMFKCPQFYCVPWSYVCDGKWDCPGGHDENLTNFCIISKDCQNMFKCKSTNKCIHLNDVCDTVVDCPEEDDETFCSLHEVRCLSSCQCLTFAMKCHNTSVIPNMLQGMLPYYFLCIQHSDKMFVWDVLKLTKQVTFLTLNQNQLEHACNVLTSPQYTLIIDLSFNLIKRVENYCFRGGTFVKVLKLGANVIMSLQQRSFYDLKYLLLLDLSDNNLQKMESNTFVYFSSLKLLLLQHNKLVHINPKSLQEIELLYLSTDDYRLCCIKHHAAKCSKTQNAWYISCKALLTSFTVKMLTYVVAILVTILSIISLMIHMYSLAGKAFSQAFVVTVSSVNIMDLTYGLYLIILILVDLHYKDWFFLFDIKYRSSLVCLFCSAIVLYFSFMSPLLLLFLSVQRYMILSDPLQTKLKESKYAIRRIGTLSIICVILVIETITTIQLSYGGLTLSICSPLVDPTNSRKFLKAVIFFTVAVQFSALVLIMYTSVKIIQLPEKTLMQPEGEKLRKSTKAVTIQIVYMIISNALSWVPSGIIYILLMFLNEYPIDTVLITALVITPINSICIPLLFVIKAGKKLATERTSRDKKISAFTFAI